MSQNIAPFLVQFSVHFLGSSGGSVVQNLSANAGDAGLISLGQKDPLEQEMATPLQKSWLANPMDIGAWQAVVHGVAKGLDMT